MEILAELLPYEWFKVVLRSILDQEILKETGMYYSLNTYKCHNCMSCSFYDHFLLFFWQLHKHLSLKLGTDGHFRGLNLSKSQLDQKLQHKTIGFMQKRF